MRDDLPSQPDFPDFYRAVNDRDPFPWQTRLAEQVAKSGVWPSEIGVPTGLGKTACLDIAVWALSGQADRDPSERSAPTRIWWLVNRRLLVDSTADHAEKIRRLLIDPMSTHASDSSPVLSAVADRLRSLASSPDAEPIEVIRLRGGAATGRPTDPSQPAVILTTLPMYGSRLLFRGYGVSSSMRPIDAAMAGTDSLLLCDEAHLVTHLLDLFPKLTDCHREATPVLPMGRGEPVVVSLTATGSDPDGRFDLDEADEVHPVLRRRLEADKPVEIIVGSKPVKGDPATTIVEAVKRLLAPSPRPSSCIAFANTPATARRVFEGLKGSEPGGVAANVALLTGRTREREAQRIRSLVLDPEAGIPAGRPIGDREEHLVVVATQTLEVGADLDVDYLVTEACGTRALIQRLGRLNRLGERTWARAAYIHIDPGAKKEWPVYGAEPRQVLDQLTAAAPAGDSDPVVDLSPGRVATVLGAPGDAAGRAPEVLPALLWEWTKTTFPPDGEAPVEPYFSGIQSANRRVSVVWRAHVPEEGANIWPRVTDRESVDVPIGEARALIQSLSDDEDDALVVARLGHDRLSVEWVKVGALIPGNIVVLPCDVGGIDEWGWAPDHQGRVLDVSVLEWGLPLDAIAIERLCGFGSKSLVERVMGSEDPDERAGAAEELRQALSEHPPPGIEADEWSVFVAELAGEPTWAPGEVPRLQRVASDGEGLSDDLDELSLTTTAIELDPHLEAVGRRARAIARAVGIAPDLADVLHLAGRFHDLGKADARFQRWLDPDGLSAKTLAKSQSPRRHWARARAAAGWPAGGRHEVLSARLVCDWLEAGTLTSELSELDRALLIHLVVSHHGKGRPFVLPVPDQEREDVAWVVDDTEITANADLSVVDWDQPVRFAALDRRLGPWGLALLEAVVRRSDHSVSAGGWAGGEVS